MDKIIIYTDGSALANGAADSGCGWACKLIYKGHERMKSGGDIGKTNNQMEIIAVLEALRSITNKQIPVKLYSDSRYVVETLNENYAIRKNKELWARLMREKEKFASIEILWVKGHDKCKHNIDVDRRAVEEARKAKVRRGGSASD